MTLILQCDMCGITEAAENADWPNATISLGEVHCCPECYESLGWNRDQSTPMPGGDPVETYDGWERH